MSRAETPTLLSLDRFARIMGINPVHFSGAVGTAIFPAKGNCSDVWFQHSYIGSDRVAREDLARAIANAEEDIARVLGYWPAPSWISREMHQYPRNYDRTVFDSRVNVRGALKSVKANWGRLISPGQRTMSFLGRGTFAGGELVWTDPDGDGFNELATLTIPNLGGLSSASRQQVKVYIKDHSTPEWEVRPVKSIAFVVTDIIITFDFWMLIDPALTDTYPTGTLLALEITDAIYVDTLDVWREWNDHTQPSAAFYWEPNSRIVPCPSCGGTGCEVCQLTVQNGCFLIRDVMLGIVVPSPATWNATSLMWESIAYQSHLAPDQVKLWYYAGEMSEGFLAGVDLDPLGTWLAEAIAWLAVARLERNFCTCSGLAAVQQELRSEMSRSDPNGPNWFLTDALGDNPFGTKMGEVKAWRRLSKLAQTIPQVAVI
jgi:hypothetical protein